MARNISLQRLLKDADERVKQAAADALNQAGAELKAEVKANMDKQHIKEDTGKLLASIDFTKADKDHLYVLLKSEVYAKIPKNPGRDNPAMKGRYKKGVPYGRIIEFGRINKPFFYTAWYDKRKEIREQIMEKIGNAWSGS